jgi:hypothetical protein
MTSAIAASPRDVARFTARFTAADASATAASLPMLLSKSLRR